LSCRTYKKLAQLTLAQRCEIQIGLSLNQSYSQIGSTIDKDKSVVSKEIKRSSDARNGKYRAQLAHEKATNIHIGKNKKEYFTAENKKYVEKYLAEKFSPEQIVGRADRRWNILRFHPHVIHYPTQLHIFQDS